MVKRKDLIEKYGSEEAVSEHYRQMQVKSREKYKGTGGFHHLKKTDPEKFKEVTSKGGRRSKRGVQADMEQ